MCIFGYGVRSPADVRRVPEVPEERPFLASTPAALDPAPSRTTTSGGTVRRTVVGLLSLTLASGLGVGASGSAWAHAPGSAPGARHAGDRQDRTGRRRARRRARPAQPAGVQAARAASGGAHRRHQRGGHGAAASTAAPSSRSAGPPAHPGRHCRAASGATRHGQPRTSTSSWPGRRPTRSSSILAEFGNQRHPSYPDQDTDPRHPGPDDVRRPAAQPDPRSPTARSTTPPSGRPTTTRTTTASSTSARARASSR